MKHFLQTLSCISLFCVLWIGPAFGQISITSSLTYTENFNFLPTSGTATWLNNANGSGSSYGKTGIYGVRTGTGTTIVAGTGSSNAGGLYSFGNTTTDRALGSLGSSNAAVGSFAYGIRFVNNTGKTITGFTLSYAGEQWRVASPTPNTVAFSYHTGDSTTLSPSVELPGGFIAVQDLDFTSPIVTSAQIAAGLLDGNAEANRKVLAKSVANLTVLSGKEILLRWYDPDHSGADHGMSIDDVSITFVTQDSDTPLVSTSKTTLTGFTYVENATTSPSQNFTVSGANLTGIPGEISVTAPANFEVSLDNATFANQVVVAYTDSILTATPVYVRLKSGLAAGQYPATGTSTIAIAGSGQSTSVTVSGSVSPAPTGNEPCSAPSATISSVRSGIVGNAFTVTGRVSGIYSGTNIYIQDATGGILIYDQAGIQPEELQIGDEVQVTGTLTLYNTEKELTTLTCFQKTTAGNSPVTPLVIASSDLCNHQGELVTINEDVTITSPAGATFAGANTNYTLSNGLIMRVLSSTNLSGATRPTTAFKPTGVVTIFNNGCQILPRSTDDVPGSTPLQGGSCGTASAPTDEAKLEVTNWNVEWLGNTGYGPTNEALQLANVKTVLNGIGSDVFMLQEVCSYNASNPADPATSFGSIIQGLNQTYPSRQYAGECSSRYSYSEVTNPDPAGQRVCIIYRTDQITKISSRPMLTQAPVTGYPTGNNSQFWASGRLPFLLTADVKLNGATEATRMHFIGLHAKSGSDVPSYNRRVYDYKVLYDTLQSQFTNERIVMAGDFNDDVDQSITGTGQISSVKAFLYANPNTTNISDTRPNANWSSVTQIFSNSGCSSTASYPDFIDHVFVSNEILLPVSSGRAMATSVAVAGVYSLRPSISGYRNNTSDHYPTFTQLSIVEETPTPVTWLDFKGKTTELSQVELTWSTASEKNNAYFEIQRSANAQDFETIGTVKGQINATQQTAYAFTDVTPAEGLNYYRLKQMDNDGKYSFSRSIAVELFGVIKVGPNPTSGSLKIDGKQIQSIQLRTLTGQLLKKSSVNEVELGDLPAGTYLLEIQTKGHSTVRRMIIKQ